MMHFDAWQEDTRYDGLGKPFTLCLRQINRADDWHRAYLQVQTLGDDFRWVANVVVAHDSQSSQLAYGMLPMNGHTIEDAKDAATATAYRLLRKAEERRALREALR